jgi:hypothetical protein
MPYNDTTEQNQLLDRVEYRADMVSQQGQAIGLPRPDVYEEMEAAALQLLTTAARPIVAGAATDAAGSAPVTGIDGGAEVELPTGALRVLSVRLAEWAQTLYRLTEPGSRRFRVAAQPTTRAKPSRPVAAWVAASSGGAPALRCYPAATDPTVERLLLLTETPPEAMPARLMDPLLWETVGRALQADNLTGAESAYAKAQARLQQLTGPGGRLPRANAEEDD